MHSAEFHFQGKNEIIEWFKKEIPDYYNEYVVAKERIKNSGMSGFSTLIKRDDLNNNLQNFLTSLTEINLANLFLNKHVKDLKYEPSEFVGIDFSFENILMSVKTLTVKNYEKIENQEIERLKSAGGGKNTLQHKKFSDTHIEVEKNIMGTYTYTRLETGHSGFLNSDIDQLSPILKYLGEFENQSNIVDYKKVMFVLIHSSEFHPYHALDIGLWYFDTLPDKYRRIFENDLSWYFKLFGKKQKENTIDAIIFLFPPRPLIWPTECFQEIVNTKPRMSIFSRDNNLLEQLKSIFS